ncbi:hypothetical protein KDL29_01775 [bacterium]|nr:hypothetical protein [bacterium]
MEFQPESKAESVIRNLVIVVLLIVILTVYPHLTAWQSRVVSIPPMIEKAWLDESSHRVYIDMAYKRSSGDTINTNAIFICSASQISPEASHCKGDGDRVEATHIHSDPFVWHVIWSETKPGHFKSINPDAELVVPGFGMLKSGPLPDEVLEAIRNEDAVVVIAVNEKLFGHRFITEKP